MSAYTLYINGTPHPVQLGTLEVSKVANGVDTLTADIASVDASVRPPIDAVAILVDDAAGSPAPRLFGGFVTAPGERGLGAIGDVPIVTGITCADFNVLTQRIYLNETIPAGSLKARLQVVEAAFAAAGYAVTLDPSQVTGPTLPERAYPYSAESRIDNVLNDAVRDANGVTETGWTHEIDYYMVLRAVETGTVPAPYNIAIGEGDPVGDMEVTPTRNDTFADRIIVIGTPNFQLNRVDEFTAGPSTDTIALGAVAAEGSAFRGYLTVDGVAENIGTGPAQWLWDLDARPQTLTRQAGAVTPGAIIRITYDGTVSAVAIADDLVSQAAHGVWEAVETLDNLLDAGIAQTIADAILAERSQLLKVITYTTHDDGLAPGQTQHIEVPIRNLDDDALITSVVTRELADAPGVLAHEVTAIAGPSVQGDWRDIYKKWLGDGNVSSAPTVSAGTGTASAAPPLRSVQFNRAGSFGGSEDALIDEDGTGDTYGVEDKQATLMVQADDPEPRLQQAWVNKTAGKAKALTLWMIDDATSYFELDAAGAAIAISSYQGAVQLSGGTGVQIEADAPTSGNFIQLRKLIGLDSLFASTQRFTNNFTMDAGLSGGMPEFAVLLDAATAKVMTLGAPTDTTMSLGLTDAYNRIILVRNEGAGAWTLTPASGNLYGPAGPVASLTLNQYQSAILGVSVGTLAGWHVYATSGVASTSGAGSGDVVGPASSVDSEFALFNSTTGKLIKRATGTGFAYATSGVYSVVSPDTDLALAGGVLSTAAGIRPFSVTLTDAQIKALPSGPFSLQAAPGSGIVIDPLWARLVLNATAGAYGNINAGATVTIAHNGAPFPLMSYLVNDAGITTGSATRVTDMFGSAASKRRAILVPWQDSEGLNQWGTIPAVFDQSAAENKALELNFDNVGSGNLTGGNAANSLQIIGRYLLA